MYKQKAPSVAASFGYSIYKVATRESWLPVLSWNVILFFPKPALACCNASVGVGVVVYWGLDRQKKLAVH